jgi:hydrogenase-4 membrane subunit HyfE
MGYTPNYYDIVLILVGVTVVAIIIGYICTKKSYNLFMFLLWAIFFIVELMILDIFCYMLDRLNEHSKYLIAGLCFILLINAVILLFTLHNPYKNKKDDE